MLKIKKSLERGQADHGWLKSFFSFSFADYYDPDAMGFRALRVINEDEIAPASGFPMHPHRDMEILTYVVRGELEHRDNHGLSKIVRPGDVQRMSAGRGVFHSEANPSSKDKLHLLQIWIVPEQKGLPFDYDQRCFSKSLAENNIVLIASASGRDGSILVRQDVDLYASRSQKECSISYELREGRYFWLQLIRGEVQVNEKKISAGDAIFGEGERHLAIETKGAVEFLLFDLA